MGWANCGTDSQGRPIGYAFEAVCDHPECSARIHRGLEYACGGMHGDTERGCEKYFCYEHLLIYENREGETWQCCKECYDELCKDYDPDAEEESEIEEVG